MALIVTSLLSCKDSKPEDQTQTGRDSLSIDNSGVDATMPEDAVYTCPMHPKVIGNQGDKCPECDMDLVVKDPVATGE